MELFVSTNPSKDLAGFAELQHGGKHYFNAAAVDSRYIDFLCAAVVHCLF